MTRIIYESNQQLEMVASHLRSQITRLSDVLQTIECAHGYEDDYIEQTLRFVEVEINRLRKIINE